MNKFIASIIIIAELAGLILTLIERKHDITDAYKNLIRKKPKQRPTSDRLKRTHIRRR
jgi:hypothetical protein